MQIQERIKQLMEIRGWTDYKLCKEANLQQATLSQIRNKGYTPTIPTLEAICGAFGITIAQFFMEEGEAVTLTKEQMEILILWETLSSEQREHLYALLKSM